MLTTTQKAFRNSKTTLDLSYQNMNNNQTTWQLSMGPNDFDFIVGFLNKHELPNTIKYPKGSANMKRVPSVSDRVVITCKAKLMARGFIYEKFHDAFNPHVNSSKLYTTIMVDEIVYEQPYMKGKRRNWTEII